MIVKIPNNFIPERSYILDMFMSHFLGLEYQLLPDKSISDYQFILENDARIIIQDHFFSRVNSRSYLETKNFPSEPKFSKNPFLSDQNTVILYGNDYFSQVQNQIVCGNDIFAASFFMLTRWEEFVIKQKDEYDRFPEEKAYLLIHNLNLRPIVNEYLEMFWQMLIHLGFQQTRKQKTYQLKITHDIDFIRKYTSFPQTLKSIVGDFLVRKSLKLAFRNSANYFKFLFNKTKDPFDVFDFFMDISDKHQLKSHFYFIPARAEEKETTYSIKSKKAIETIQNINKRGHLIGYHAGWNAFKNYDIFVNEIKSLEQISGKTTEGRQHYLRFQIPSTWCDWEKSGRREDSTLGFSKNIGFRCGTCYSFPVFDILQKRRLNLIENPLIIMDIALKNAYTNPKEMFEAITQIGKTIQKYNGTLVLLWHNTSINNYEWENYAAFYQEMIKTLALPNNK